MHFPRRNENFKFSAPQQCLESKDGLFLIREIKIQIPNIRHMYMQIAVAIYQATY